MSKRSQIVEDSWLSGILKRNVYRLSMNDEFMKSAQDGFFQKEFSRPVFIYSKVGPTDVPHIAFLERHGFHLADTQVSFEKAITSSRQPKDRMPIRFAIPRDERQIMELARRNFTYSRFHMDPNISHDAANEIKAKWVQNFFLGKRGDKMVVALMDGRIVGFIQLLWTADQPLIIDLIATDRDYQRRGIAKKMIAFAESNCSGIRRIRVGTQLSNLPSIGLYEGLGFKIFETRHVFHYHRV